MRRIAPMSKMTPIPKGAVFYVSTGAYSDYTVGGVFRALEEIDADTLREKWLAMHPDQREDYKFNDTAFLTSLAHMFEPIEAWEWHMCDYSGASEMFVANYDASGLKD